MNIGIIVHPYGEDKPAGLARIIFELSRELILRDTHNHYVIFLKERPKVMPVFAGNNWHIEILGKGVFWLERLRTKTLCDVYIFNTPALPVFWKPPYALVLALDFAYWYFPSQGIRGFVSSRLTYWYHWLSLARADRIVCISEATRRDIAKLFPGISGTKTTTVYFGFHDIGLIPENAIPELKPGFLLFVGVWKERKNVLGVVQAFALFVKKHPEAKLVMAGKQKGAYAKRVWGAIKEYGLMGHVVLLGFVSDAELSFLYHNATALIFPSFVEGFGFPILEAMAAGLPVVTSQVSSLQEIAGNAALCVDPYSTTAIADALDRIYSDAVLREDLRRRGLARAKEFSWDHTVTTFSKLFKTKDGK